MAIDEFRTRAKQGFTLIETMVVLGVLVLFFSFAFSTIVGTIRVVTMENSVLEMDKDANQVLNAVADALRPAILPIPPDGNDAMLTSFARNVLASQTMGFKSARGNYWRDVLQVGTDCIAFTVPVDFGNDGDFLDGDEYIELGIIPPNSGAEFGASYTIDPTTQQNHLNGASVNRFLAALDANNDLRLENPVQNLNPNALPARFDDDFTLPNNGQAYALIRFVPYRLRTGAPLTMSEAALRYDLNKDGDTADTFMLGRMEFVYSNARASISGATVLLQINRVNDRGWTPIFKLIKYDANGNSINNPTGFVENQTQGDYALLIRLLLCDTMGQQDPLTFANTTPALVRQFETTVKLRNLTIAKKQ